MKNLKSIIKFSMLLSIFICVMFNAYSVKAAKTVDSTEKWICKDIDSSNKTVSIKPNGAKIAGVSSGKVSIPATVKISGTTYKVTKLLATGWQENLDITQVSFTNATNLTWIAAHAFEDCKNLKSIVNLDNTKVTLIGEYSFKGCKALSSTIYLPATKLNISDYAFCGCSSISGFVGKNTVIKNAGQSAFRDVGDYTTKFYVKDYDSKEKIKASGPAHFDFYVTTYRVEFCSDYYSKESLPNAIAAEYGKEYKIPNTILTNPQQGFLGWRDTRKNYNKFYAPGSTFINLTKTGETVYIYAEWKAKYFYITFDKNGSNVSGEMETIRLSFNDPFKIPRCKFRRTGYDYDDWDFEVYSPDGKTKMDDLDLFSECILKAKARWIPIKYTIKAHICYPGYDNVQTVDAVYDKSYTIAASRKGYYLAGWSKSANSEIIDFPASNMSNLTNHKNDIVDIYSVWKPVEYTICYHPYITGESAKVDGTMKNQSMAYDKAAKLSKCSYKRDGYTFAGWVDKNGIKYSNGQNVINLLSTTGTFDLYAMWTKNAKSSNKSKLKNNGNNKNPDKTKTSGNTKWKRPGKPKKKSVVYRKKGNGYTVTVRWKAKNAKRFQYRYSVKAKKLKSAKKHLTKHKYAKLRLKKGKRITFQVRSWKKNSSGKKVYSAWKKIKLTGPRKKK